MIHCVIMFADRPDHRRFRLMGTSVVISLLFALIYPAFCNFLSFFVVAYFSEIIYNFIRRSCVCTYFIERWF